MTRAERISAIKARHYAAANRRELSEKGKDKKREWEDMNAVACMRRYSRTM